MHRNEEFFKYNVRGSAHIIELDDGVVVLVGSRIKAFLCALHTVRMHEGVANHLRLRRQREGMYLHEQDWYFIQWRLAS